MRRSLLIWCLLLAGIICIAQSDRVSAFWNSRGSNYNKSIVSGGGGTAVTWDPAETDSNITLSPDKLTASITLPSTSNYLGRATGSVGASSQVYWEILNNSTSSAANALGLGIVDSSFTIPQLTQFLGGDAHGLGYYDTDAVIFNGSTIANLAGYGHLDVIGFAVDTINNKLWARINNAGWNNDILANQNPATNTGGLAITMTAPLYPALVFRSDSGTTYSVTGQFASGSFSFTPPAGFTHL